MEILEFRIFLAKACKNIPVKKLKNRIYRELREHMEDMLDGFLEAGEEREAAIQKVVREMGDPVKINKNLRRAHRRKIILVRSAKVLSLLFSVLFLLNTVPMLVSTASHYCSGSTKEDIDAALLQSEYNYEYLGEIERNGRVYLLYTCETPEENRVQYFESIKLLGKFNIHDRFSGNGAGKGSENILITLNRADESAKSETKVYFSFKPIKAKYFKMGFTKKYGYENDGMPDDIISDFIAVPNIGEYVIIDAPEGYRFSGYYYPYDKDKQLLKYNAAYDPNVFPLGESWESRVSDSFGNS